MTEILRLAGSALVPSTSASAFARHWIRMDHGIVEPGAARRRLQGEPMPRPNGIERVAPIRVAENFRSRTPTLMHNSSKCMHTAFLRDFTEAPGVVEDSIRFRL